MSETENKEISQNNVGEKETGNCEWRKMDLGDIQEIGSIAYDEKVRE